MKKLFFLTVVLMGAATASQAAVRFSLGIGLPLPGVVIRQPAPVVVAPPPVVYQAAPVYYPALPAVCYPAPPLVVYQAPPVVCALGRGVYLGFRPAWHGHYYRGWRY
jgi:hypothetical protein